jgi:hypothetical protein
MEGGWNQGSELGGDQDHQEAVRQDRHGALREGGREGGGKDRPT